MGREWHVGVDAELGMHPGACVRGGLGVARAEADADADIISADIASGAKDARVVMSDILLDLNVMIDDEEEDREGVSDVFLIGDGRCGSLFGK
jgi:hypothetical protein